MKRILWVIEFKFDNASGWFPNNELVFTDKVTAMTACIVREKKYPGTAYRVREYAPKEHR